MEVWNEKEYRYKYQMEKWREKQDADVIKSRNGWKRTRHPYLAHFCPVQHGVLVVFLLSASDEVIIGTKLPAKLSPILGHLLVL